MAKYRKKSKGKSYKKTYKKKGWFKRNWGKALIVAVLAYFGYTKLIKK